MNREQALQALGLYVGATPQHIEDKYARKRAEVEASLSGAELSSAVAQLELARSAAHGEETHAQPPKRKVFAGSVVLGVIVAALVIYTVVTLTVGANLDGDLAETQARKAKTDAAQWVQALRDNKPPVETPEMKQQEGVVAAAWQEAETLLAGEKWNEAEKKYREAVNGASQVFTLQRAHPEKQLDAVIATWRDELRTRFPFNPDSKDDAPLEVVERLFNPVSGTYWKAAAEFERLGAIEVGAVRAAPPPGKFTATRASVNWLTDALFEGKARRHVSFSARVSNPRPWRIELALGEQSIVGDAKDFTSVVWRDEVARITFAHRDDDPEKTPEGGPWSLLRILWRFELEQDDHGVMMWRFEGDPDARRRPRDPMTIAIEAHAANHPFDPAAFRGFSIG
jgi:hypothetical protein